MKILFKAYRDLLLIMFKEARFMTIVTILCSVLGGLLVPFSIYVNQNVFDNGIAVAEGEMIFSDYFIYLLLFVLVAMLPFVIHGVVWNYAQPRSLLILRTVYKSRMLQKLKTMKYEHFESKDSMEIIDKAYNRAENSARHLWPMYIVNFITAIIASGGILWYASSIRWWLVLTILFPFFLETYFLVKSNFNIYDELETYWQKERKYTILGQYLKSREYFKDLKSFGSASFLIDLYKKRLSHRNKEYESFFFKNLKNILLGGNITQVAAVVNVLILLWMFTQQEITIGLFISLTGLLLSGVYENLKRCAVFFRFSGFHINTFEFYNKFFDLSDDTLVTKGKKPTKYDIEFRDVWFKYPGTDKHILKGISFNIMSGEKISLIGKNGEGKSTIIKLLLGLFHPDSGDIFIGGKNLSDCSAADRSKMIGFVLQDFTRYSITVKENIGIGDIDNVDNINTIYNAATKSNADTFIENLDSGYETLLGRDFAGGIDISGGQWQRLSIARAFMGDKPILLLDEPTSQLDPMAEADLYTEFAEMARSKTALFVTHRLGATAITDRILLIDDGKVAEFGTHSELLDKNGIYAQMFNSQKQWYENNELPVDQQDVATSIDNMGLEKNGLNNVKFEDNTSAFESDILKTNPLRLYYLLRIFNYIFTSAKTMCAIFLILAITLSLMQPFIAFVWGAYIDNAVLYESSVANVSVVIPVSLLLLYWMISFLSSIIERFLYGQEDIERLSKVQDHRLQEKFQAKMFEKISKLYPDYMEVPRINDIIARSFDAIGSEWSSLQKDVIIEGYMIIAKLFSVVVIAVSLYSYHPALLFITLIAPLPTIYTTYVGNKLIYRFSRDHSSMLREADYYQGVLLGKSAKEVKALNTFDFFYGKWKRLVDNYTVKEKKNQIAVFFLNASSSLISNFASIAASIISIVLLTRGYITIGALAAVFILINTLMDSTTRLFASISNFVSKKNEAAQIFEFLDLAEQSVAVPALSNICFESLSVKGVSYRYPLTGLYRITNVNFNIFQGEKIAFVGVNGAGKSTFVKLLTGMLVPSSGEILLNGNEVGNLKNIYNITANVFQEPLKFNSLTIGDNVFLGDVLNRRCEKRIDESLDFAGFDYPDKDLLLGKDIGGTDLSGGQWQKISIARTYYRDKDLIVLDEPTSNLDPIAEAELFRKYIKMTDMKTVIIVTHRISLASMADKIVVFKNGEIVEVGDYTSLIRNNGEFSRLYSHQSQWYNR